MGEAIFTQSQMEMIRESPYVAWPSTPLWQSPGGSCWGVERGEESASHYVEFSTRVGTMT